MKAVIGLGFGDEGKGLTTSFLCEESKNPIVVRFNGGHQAGHTVVYEGQSHIFSNFGSGSLQGVPTLWSHYCTFNPMDALNEYKALNNPTLYVHGLCPVTTPMDVLANRDRESIVRHGSVGMGFGSTIQRQDDYYKLFAQDLPFEHIVLAKLNNISNYYSINIDVEPFLASVREVLTKVTIVPNYDILEGYTPIFEGAQGILLDMDFGFFPNVTRSNTTSRNAVSVARNMDIYYATRTYQTRHGNGYMSNEGLPLNLANTENETNTLCEWQGVFRKSVLDIDLLNYALICDNNFSSHCRKNLLISCVDQTGYDFDVTVDGKLKHIDLNQLPKLLCKQFDRVLYSTGASLTDVQDLQYSFA